MFWLKPATTNLSNNVRLLWCLITHTESCTKEHIKVNITQHKINLMLSTVFKKKLQCVWKRQTVFVSHNFNFHFTFRGNYHWLSLIKQNKQSFCVSRIKQHMHIESLYEAIFIVFIIRNSQNSRKSKLMVSSSDTILSGFEACTMTWASAIRPEMSTVPSLHNWFTPSCTDIEVTAVRFVLQMIRNHDLDIFVVSFVLENKRVRYVWWYCTTDTTIWSKAEFEDWNSTTVMCSK